MQTPMQVVLRLRCALQYPNGRRDGEHCDIYWHGVHFSETTQLYNGKVNKFPGKWFGVFRILNADSIYAKLNTQRFFIIIKKLQQLYDEIQVSLWEGGMYALK